MAVMNERRQEASPPPMPEMPDVDASSAPAVQQQSPTSTSSAAAVATPSTASNATAPQKQCFKNANGAEICLGKSTDVKNVTDVHNENGVYDYHNQNHNNLDETVAGKTPGTNISAALPFPDIPTNPYAPQATSTGGSTVFEGEKIDNESGSQDIHNQPGDYENHKEDADYDSTGFKSSFKAPGDFRSSTNVNQTSDARNMTDIQIHNGTKDTVVQNSNTQVGQMDYKDNSPQAGQNTVDIDTLDENKHEMEEHKGQDGTYDLHESTSSKQQGSWTFTGSNAFANLGKAFQSMFSGVGPGSPGTKLKRRWERIYVDNALYTTKNDPVLNEKITNHAMLAPLEIAAMSDLCLSEKHTKSAEQQICCRLKWYLPEVYTDDGFTDRCLRYGLYAKNPIEHKDGNYTGNAIFVKLDNGSSVEATEYRRSLGYVGMPELWPVSGQCGRGWDDVYWRNCGTASGIRGSDAALFGLGQDNGTAVENGSNMTAVLPPTHGLGTASQGHNPYALLGGMVLGLIAARLTWNLVKRRWRRSKQMELGTESEKLGRYSEVV